MVSELIGRDEELAALRTFLTGCDEWPAALVLEGEAGIGKSALWLAGVAEAEAAGLRVLRARPAEVEQGLTHAGLGDLLEGVLDDVGSVLSTPRRRALEIVLLRERASGEPVDDRALAVAVRDVLQALCDRGPVLIAVDDVQWFDPSSTAALAFALRRLSTSRLLLLLTRRVVDRSQPSELERALGTDRVEPLPVGPLSVGALHQFLRDRLSRPFARQTLLRVHERSRGNPFFALELARVLDADLEPFSPLPVPETLDELVRARLSGLPPTTREALAFAAVVGTASEPLLERAGVAGALGPAFEAHVIERDAGMIRFTHPLLAAAVYQGLGEERRRLHERIAELSDDPLVRSRHLAHSRHLPDAEVARQLDDAAALAAERGAVAMAAELAEQAQRLTPPEAVGDRNRRALAAARAHRASGEWTRARSLASGLLQDATEGELRAEALVLLAELESIDASVRLLERAAREAAGRPALLSMIQCRLAWATRFENGAAHARAALELAEQLDDEVLLERARAVQAVLGWFAGDPDAPPLPERPHDFALAVGGELRVQEAMQAVVNTQAPAPTRGAARALLEREHREWRDRNEPRSARALWGLAWVEFWAGRWELAASHAAHAHDISSQYGLEVPQDHLPIAVVAVHRGRLELAREHSERALELGREQFGSEPPQHIAVLGLAALWCGDAALAEQWLSLAERRCTELGWREPSLRWWSADYAELLLGLAALWGGDAALAEQWLSLAERRCTELGWREPSLRWWSADYAELLLGLGRTAEAAGLVDVWEADAVRVGREWVLAHVTRCRGLAAAAEGDAGRSQMLLERAVEQHEAVGDPYGRARALLALGSARRRLRQKRAARDAIGAALAAFEDLGAEVWARKARAELGRIGGRTREKGLTAAERRVAALVAQGRTNREVAGALFLGERTVASHLTHIYAKLGIRSRVELARRFEAEHGKVQTF
jgi:DNA-binding CsgD family transcriptional regulator